MQFFRYFFEQLFPNLLYLVDVIFDLFASPVYSLIEGLFDIDLPTWIQELSFLDLTLVEFMIGSGIIYFLGYSFIKWITDIAA